MVKKKKEKNEQQTAQNNSNVLADSEAKPECFNFTFNPKDEGSPEEEKQFEVKVPDVEN